MGLDNPVKVIVLLLIILLVFGAKRLPEMGRGLGKGLREFRDATKGLGDDVKAAVEEPKAVAPAPPVEQPRPVEPPKAE